MSPPAPFACRQIGCHSRCSSADRLAANLNVGTPTDKPSPLPPGLNAFVFGLSQQPRSLCRSSSTATPRIACAVVPVDVDGGAWAASEIGVADIGAAIAVRRAGVPLVECQFDLDTAKALPIVT